MKCTMLNMHLKQLLKNKTMPDRKMQLFYTTNTDMYRESVCIYIYIHIHV